MRILGITISDNKQVVYGLTDVYGIGMTRSKEILEKLGIELTRKVKDITADEETQIRKTIEDYGFTLEGDLRRQKSQNIKRLKDIMANRGMRHSRGLPVRGQRTKTNSRTVRGNKRATMGSGKTKVEKK